jgi:SCY1-like protein 3
MRPLLSAIQLHNYFTHDFVIIHGFLSELALKTQPSKQEFFKTLNEKLKQFDENTIGSQLSELLLSRLVLLDPAAQFYFIPFLLKPQNLEDDDEASDGLFSTPTFVKFIVPKLKQVFRVLDVQIRLTLLEHFHLYVNTFSKEELIDEILPQLLLGIKDTNDLLVTKTLLCLADLIPILGASLVIGKNRRKLFADGRPQQQTEVWSNDQPRSITPVMNASMDILLSSSPVDNVDISEYSAKNSVVANGIIPTSSYQNDDGDTTEEDNEWGWDQDQDTTVEVQSSVDIEPVIIIEEMSLVSTSPIKEKIMTRPKIPDNIDELDIKNQKLTKLEEKQNEVDFFSDFGMAPTIKAPAFQEPTAVTQETETSKADSSRLQMSIDEGENDGWGEDDDNWNENSEEAL